MPFLREYAGGTLQWKRPHFFSTTYELRAGERLLATLNLIGIMKQRALAEAEGQQWTFQREGLMGRKCVIYPGVVGAKAARETVQALAVMQPGWSGTGTLNLHDGRSYAWTRTGSWRPVWSWIGADGKTLLSIKKGRLLEVAATASDQPDLALLSLFGLYLLLMKEADEAATAAAVAGAASG